MKDRKIEKKSRQPLRDSICHRRRLFGLAQTMEVWKPAKQNGAGVLVMCSGGWHSAVEMIDAGFFTSAGLKPLTDRGYTIFFVCHGCQPKFTVNEIVPQIHRAVRFIRTHAADYGVDPNRLGITGISSGGHLSLSMGAFGKDGDPKAKDPVDRASSRVQAVACFCPPCDLVDYGTKGKTFVEFEGVKFVWHAMPVAGKPKDEQIKILRGLSPFAALTKESAPTLILHGTKDLLVPYEQAERHIAKLKELGVAAELVTRQDAGHTWPGMGKDFAVVGDWFDKQLGK
jgi:acetyl esterase/lipase